MALIIALVSLASCGGQPSFPGGVYKSTQYHFSISYPPGWQANASSQTEADVPLIVIITRSGSRNTREAPISSLTIDVLDMSNPTIAQTAASLQKDTSLSQITFAGLPAYRDKPVQQKGGGNESSQTVTHEDYYLVHGGYEYQVSLDALTADQKTLDAMAQTFKILN